MNHRGIGPDAHTASLFPGDPLIQDRRRIVDAAFAGKFNQWRVTLLPAALLAAKHTLVLATGADKAEALARVFGPERDETKFPAQIGVVEDVPMTWFVTGAHAPPGRPLALMPDGFLRHSGRRKLFRRVPHSRNRPAHRLGAVRGDVMGWVNRIPPRDGRASPPGCSSPLRSAGRCAICCTGSLPQISSHLG